MFQSLSFFTFRLALGLALSIGLASGHADAVLSLPTFDAITHTPRVIATTSIIGDVVQHVAGDAIDVHTLIPAGQNPHAYQATPRDLAKVARADVIFVNGWELEEGVLEDVRAVNPHAIVPVSAGIRPLEGDETEARAQHDETHHHHAHGADPHVWFSLVAVARWSENIATVLSALDPSNRRYYQDRALSYQGELYALALETRTRLAIIPSDKRLLVSNHKAFGYLAQAHGLRIVGTVIPSFSSQAEPSAGELATLVETMRTHQLCSIITEVEGSQQLAQAVGRELDYCDRVRIVSLYTGSLGTAGSGAESYITMYRSNIDRLLEALR